jgi:hypothetical protein
VEPAHPMYLVSSTNRELVTLIEIVSGEGLVLPPIIIVPGALHMDN